MKQFYLFLTILLTTKFARGDVCTDDLFPVFSGGKRDEHVNCIVYDESTDLIIVGGNSTSADYAALSSGPFLYAIDLQGNWQWGVSFENKTNVIADISGCAMSSNGHALTILGSNYDSVPTIFEVGLVDGSISLMFSLEHSFEVDPQYTTYGAIYHDNRDSWNWNYAYIYVAFMRGHVQEYIKVQTSRYEPRIDTVYEFDSLHDRQQQATD